MKRQYHSGDLEQLCNQQVRFAPREKKIQQIDRAERLHNELKPEQMYSYEYICFRITDYRPDFKPPQPISGIHAGHDLRLFIEDVSDAANLAVADSAEPVHTVDELSRKFHVATKTIARWRQQGLVSRRFLFGKRKRLGFLASSVERFIAQHPQRVQRGCQFSQLSEAERGEVLVRARRLAEEGASPSQVAQQVAGGMRRSVETIRYTIKRHDQANPQRTIFPSESGPLSDDRKEQLYTAYRQGESVEVLARRYGRTRASIYRIVNEQRAKRLLQLPLNYIDNPAFDARGAAEAILQPVPKQESPAPRSRMPSGLPHYLASLYEVPLLSREQEQHLFRKYNYLKHCAAALRNQLDLARPKGRLMDQIEETYGRAVAAKKQIVQANLRLVVSIAKRHVDFTGEFFALVSDGNVSLIRAVENFDYGRGNKFSTYASWAIMKNFARTIPGEFKHRDRFRTSYEELFFSEQDDRADPYSQEVAQQMRAQQVGNILSYLDEREQKIIISRFGLDHACEPQTLHEIGVTLGVTKERIRQIEAKALDKLRVAAESEKIEHLE